MSAPPAAAAPSAGVVRLAVGPGLSPTAIREDRILHEALATRGDVRRLTDLFGLSVHAASRYATVDDDDFRTSGSANPPPHVGGPSRPDP